VLTVGVLHQRPPFFFSFGICSISRLIVNGDKAPRTAILGATGLGATGGVSILASGSKDVRSSFSGSLVAPGVAVDAVLALHPDKRGSGATAEVRWVPRFGPPPGRLKLAAGKDIDAFLRCNSCVAEPLTHPW